MPASYDYDDEKMKPNKKIMIPIEEIKALRVLGRGATGTVFMVLRDGCDLPFALKVISKADEGSRQDAGFNRWRDIERERDILSSLRHPLLPSLIAQVETDKIIGWVVEYCPGGNLHRLRQIQPDKMFSESAIRFYAAEVVLALEHLHEQGIVYRDLKPENILVQSTGHIMLTDFDLSTRLSLPCKQSCATLSQEKGRCNSPHPLRAWLSLSSVLGSKKKTSSRQSSGESEDGMSTTSTSSGRSNSFVGTEEYVAPEVVNGSGHEFPVDWWALGILLYEMLYGKTPFRGSNKKETYRRILWMKPQLTGPHSPLHELIVRLLEKDPRRRLGSRNGSSDVKGHVFFAGLHWDSIESLCRPPFVPDDDDAVPATTESTVFTFDMERFVMGSHNGSECEETSSESDVEGLF